MGWNYRKRIRISKNSWINLSKRGASGSVRAGRFTLNSRGRSSIRLGKGLNYRGGCVSALAITVAITTILVRTASAAFTHIQAVATEAEV